LVENKKCFIFEENKEDGVFTDRCGIQMGDKSYGIFNEPNPPKNLGKIVPKLFGQMEGLH